MSTHLYPEVAAHVMRVTETAHWLEWQDWVDPILQKPYEITDGLLHIPDVPGIGLEWNEDAVMGKPGQSLKSTPIDDVIVSTFEHGTWRTSSSRKRMSALERKAKLGI
jgi:hypothetical protein